MNKREKENIKSLLRRWGGVVDYCKELTIRIKELEKICADSSYSVGISYDYIRTNVQISSRVENTVIKTIMIYEKQMEEYEKEIENALKEKSIIDYVMSTLENDEQKVIILRYKEGLSWDNIPDIIHKSRKQCFRIHDRAIEKFGSQAESSFSDKKLKLSSK